MMYLFLSLALVGLGMMMLLRPTLLFDLTERWKSHTGSDPSRLYLFSTRLGGSMCLLAGIGGIAVFVWQAWKWFQICSSFHPL